MITQERIDEVYGPINKIFFKKKDCFERVFGDKLIKILGLS